MVLSSLSCFTNASFITNQEQVERLVQLGLIKALSDIFSSINDTTIIVLGLQILENIIVSGSQIIGLRKNPYLLMLEDEGIIDLIEKLRGHPDNHVSQKASWIIDTYLVVESDCNVFKESRKYAKIILSPFIH